MRYAPTDGHYYLFGVFLSSVTCLAQRGRAGQTARVSAYVEMGEDTASSTEVGG